MTRDLLLFFLFFFVFLRVRWIQSRARSYYVKLPNKCRQILVLASIGISVRGVDNSHTVHRAYFDSGQALNEKK